VTIEPVRIPDSPLVEAHAARIERQDDVPVLALPPAESFEALRDRLGHHLADGGCLAHLRGQTVRLELGTHDIVLFDLRRIATFLTETADVHVGSVGCTPEALHQYAERELKMRIHVALDVGADVSGAASDDDCTVPSLEEPGPDPGDSPHEPPRGDDPTSGSGATAEDAAAAAGLPSPPAPADDGAAVEDPEADVPVPIAGGGPVLSVVHTDPARASLAGALPEGGRRTVSVHRSLRSGANVRFPGDIVVFGDVNPGAEVVADGNIVVLGALRGMAHAGAHGDESATVMAFALKPAILRIAHRQATDLEFEVPAPSSLFSLLRAPGLADRGAPHTATPRVAHVVDGAVVVSDYVARALR